MSGLKRLREYYCFSGDKGNEGRHGYTLWIDCPNGCSDGACLNY